MDRIHDLGFARKVAPDNNEAVVVHKPNIWPFIGLQSAIDTLIGDTHLATRIGQGDRLDRTPRGIMTRQSLLAILAKQLQVWRRGESGSLLDLDAFRARNVDPKARHHIGHFPCSVCWDWRRGR